MSINVIQRERTVLTPPGRDTAVLLAHAADDLTEDDEVRSYERRRRNNCRRDPARESRRECSCSHSQASPYERGGSDLLHDERVAQVHVLARPQPRAPAEDLADAGHARRREEPPEARVEGLGGVCDWPASVSTRIPGDARTTKSGTHLSIRRTAL